jgi:hypothetical protein
MTTNPLLRQVADDFAVRARTAGHPVLLAGPGRWTHHDHYPCGVPRTVDGDTAPKDLLDQAREVARSRMDWVHVLVPTATDAIRLAAAVQRAPVMPRQRVARSVWADLLRRPVRTRHGDPRRVPFAQLVDQIPPTVVTLTAFSAGRAVHVVEVPAVWVSRRLGQVA